MEEEVQKSTPGASHAGSPPEHARRSDTPPAGPPVLPDPWSRRGPLPLDGWLERHGFAPWLTAGLVLIGAFFAFQILGTVVTFGLIARTVPLDQLAAELAPDRLLSVHVAETILGNSVGQVLGLALPAVFFAWLHTSRPGAFLRLRRPPLVPTLLALVGLAGLLPVVGWLTELNQQVPLPDFFQMLEDTRMDMIVKVLESDLALWVNLLGLALTPALCEELIFRGYAQRQFERSAGAAWGIALAGILFGVYHLSFAQVLPLSVLGIYLAYLTWRTGSLWPAILVHFANNAWSVVGAEMATRRPDVSLAEVESSAPWYAVLGGLILFAAVVFFLHTRTPQWRPGRGS